MPEWNRRKVLHSGEALGALGVLGALGMTAPAQARPLLGTWPAMGSVLGAGAGDDPRWVWDAEADTLLA
jgi:endo-cleaving rubber dioxygenase